jgi:carbamoyltransferase
MPIIADHQHEFFEHDHPSPFMLHVYKIRPEKRQALCAVNQEDDTGPRQTVTREENHPDGCPRDRALHGCEGRLDGESRPDHEQRRESMQ